MKYLIKIYTIAILLFSLPQSGSAKEYNNPDSAAACRDHAIVTMNSGNYNSETKKYAYYGTTIIYMKKINNIWKMADIK